MTDRQFCKYFGHLENHQFKHFNRSLGVQVESKEHFKHLLEKGNYIPYEQCQEQSVKNSNQKYEGLSEDKMRFLSQVKDLADKKGNIKITDNFVKGLQEHKVIPKDLGYYSKLPKHYEKGGFY